jgi:hypothetical protein
MNVSMTNQLMHIANVKVGKVKGKSRVYPQLRLPSRYAALAGQIASLYAMNGPDGDVNYDVYTPTHTFRR